MERMIKVVGKGNVSIKPDLVCIEITLSDVRDTYDAALKLSTAMTELLRICIAKKGIDRKEIHTTGFDIIPQYESDEDENDVNKMKLIGYRYIHKLHVELPMNNSLLSDCVKAIVDCPAKPEFKITYTIKDIESVKNLIIGKAVADARKKAEVLTQAAGIALGSIQTMKYEWGELNFVSRTDINFDRGIFDEAGINFRLNIEPENVEAGDTVTVIWSIL